jgi:hypothetical protein
MSNYIKFHTSKGWEFEKVNGWCNFISIKFMHDG